MRSRNLARRAFASMAILVAAALCSGDAPVAQEQARHEISLNARRYEFSQPRIEVAANDVVKITLVAEDIPHTFTIDDTASRSARRRAGP